MFLTRALDNLNMKYKLISLFSTVALAIIVLAVAFWFDKTIATQSAQRSDDFSTYANLVSEANTNYLKIRRYESDFNLSTSGSTGQTYNAVPLENHNKHMLILESAMSKLAELAPVIDGHSDKVIFIEDDSDTENYVQELVVQSSGVITNYKNSFQDIVRFKRAVGFQENEGLRGQAFKLSERLKKHVGANNDAFLNQYLLEILKSQEKIIQSTDLTEAYEQLKTSAARFKEQIKVAEFSENNSIIVSDELAQYLAYIDLIVSNKRLANEYTELFDFMLGPLFDEMAQSAQKRSKYNYALLTKETNTLTLVYTGATIVAAVLISLFLFFFGRSLVNPVQALSTTIHEVNDGNLDARTNENRLDEIGELSRAFDNLLDEKVAQLSDSQKENDALNESIIAVLRSVAQLAKKDFTVNIPVTEDVTGAIADSINSLASATATALREVRNTSLRVAKVSSQVRSQSNMVSDEAQKERIQAENAMEDLRVASNAMQKISNDAQNANKQADDALKNTGVALDTVIESVEGINSIRDTISETEKRIKRLGERSQEITGVVNLINSIAERTHILALNASMHAASAGEAGRGFAVVADEVQRLAENAREATREIGTLVNNIQVETTDTVSAMNNAIAHVAKGTELAERAGKAMSKTQESTKGLVDAVQIIANSSMSQARSSVSLVERAKEIVESTRQTDKHMKSQSESTKLLNSYSKRLVETVSVFKLPKEVVSKSSQKTVEKSNIDISETYIDEQEITDVAVNS